MRMGPVFFLALLAAACGAWAGRLEGQRQASLGVGTGVVRYAGGSSFSALTLSPAAQRISPLLYLGAGGAFSLLERGVWATQARADIWATLPGARALRPAVSATIAATTRSDGDAAGSGGAVLELVWTHAGAGAAIGGGAVTGVIERVSGVGAARLRGRGWWQPAETPLQLSLTLEGTRLLGAWYTDMVGGVTFDRDRIVASLWASGRVSGVSGSTGAASAAVLYYLAPALALEISGGNYLRDPFQGLPRAGFLAGGVRLFAARRSIAAPAAPALKPLIALRRGDTLVVRFRMPGARSVAIAGNWNSWTPAPLRPVVDDVWEAVLELEPGVYHFNLLVNGSEWVVPGGVATVPDGMGGLLAVLNVL
jgi:hypothetical protein